RSDLQLERSHFLSQRVALCRAKLPARRKAPIELPPIEAELLGLVQRADEQPDPDGEQLDFGERDLDVSCDHESLVEDTVENLHEPCRAIVPLGVSRAQGFGGIHVAADSTHGLLHGAVIRRACAAQIATKDFTCFLCSITFVPLSACSVVWSATRLRGCENFSAKALRKFLNESAAKISRRKAPPEFSKRKRRKSHRRHALHANVELQCSAAR